MSSLKQQIHSLEKQLNSEKYLLQQQKHVLSDFIKTPQILVPTMIGGFAFGYFSAKKINKIPFLFRSVARYVIGW